MASQGYTPDPSEAFEGPPEPERPSVGSQEDYRGDVASETFESVERPPETACYIYDGPLGQTLIKDLPTPAEIQELVDFLTRLSARAAIDTSLPVTWFTLFDEDQHATPNGSTRWIDPLRGKTRRLVEDACRALGGGLASALARAAMASSGWPPWWGDPPDHRGAGLRLLERLHIRHDADGYRVGLWLDEEGDEQPPPVTVIGLRSQVNPWWALVNRTYLTPVTGALIADHALENGPDSISLPLDGPRAGSSGLFVGVDATVPRASARRVEEISAALAQVLEETALGDLPSLLAAMLGMRIELDDPAVTSWALELPELVVTGRPLSEAGADVLRSMASSSALAALALGDGLGGPWFWLLASILPKKYDVLSAMDQEVASAQETLDRLAEDLSAVGEALDPASGLPPMVLLGPTVGSYGEDFGRYGPGSTLDQAELRGPMIAFQHLLDEAGPVLDAARMFDTAGIIAERLVELDDVLLASTSLSLGEGFVGTEFRRVLVELGLPLLSDALGGFRPAELLRYLVRQVLTDQLIGGFQDRYDVDCLYELLCWNLRAGHRDRMEAALGPLVEVPLTDVLDAGDPRDADLLDAAPWPSLWLRGCLLSGREGALGRIIDAYLRSLGNAERFHEALDPCDLGTVVDWMSDARAVCLVTWIEDHAPVEEWEFERDLGHIDRELEEANEEFQKEIFDRLSAPVEQTLDGSPAGGGTTSGGAEATYNVSHPTDAS
jgi:hypothetical protein